MDFYEVSLQNNNFGQCVKLLPKIINNFKVPIQLDQVQIMYMDALLEFSGKARNEMNL